MVLETPIMHVGNLDKNGRATLSIDDFDCTENMSEGYQVEALTYRFDAFVLLTLGSGASKISSQTGFWEVRHGKMGCSFPIMFSSNLQFQDSGQCLYLS